MNIKISEKDAKPATPFFIVKSVLSVLAATIFMSFVVMRIDLCSACKSGDRCLCWFVAVLGGAGLGLIGICTASAAVDGAKLALLMNSGYQLNDLRHLVTKFLFWFAGLVAGLVAIVAFLALR